MRSYKANKKSSKPSKDETSTSSAMSLPPPKLNDNLHKNISWDELSPEEEPNDKSPNPRKRQIQKEDEFENGADYGGDFNDLFASLKADVTKTMSAKKKKFEGYAKSSGETAKKRIDEVYSKHEHERNKLTQEFINKIKKMDDEFQEEIKKMTEAEDQVLNLFKHYHKMAQQTRNVTTSKFKTLLSTSQEYKQKCSEMNKKHQKEKEELQTDLETEMQNLQKKIISYSKQEGLTQFKKSLESMLSVEDNEL